MTLFEIIVFCVVMIPIIALVDWRLFGHEQVICSRCKKITKHGKWDWLVATFLEVMCLICGIMYGFLFR